MLWPMRTGIPFLDLKPYLYCLMSWEGQHPFLLYICNKIFFPSPLIFTNWSRISFKAFALSWTSDYGKTAHHTKPLLAIYIASWTRQRPLHFDCFKFLAPGLILNPVLFLHSVIAMPTYLRTRLEGYDQTSTYVRPHLDFHKHKNLCWLYSVFIVFEQIITFQ
jgi:hypothetical protein